jgi:indolepyruvate ferredoxin oxidoreductase
VNATPTAAFVKNPDWQNPAQACVDALVNSLGADAVGTFDAETAATRLMGDSLYTNPMMLGYAWQKGWLPLELASLLRAIELNAVQIDKNKAAFEWGRRAAHDPKAVAALWQKAGAGEQVIQFKKRDSLDDLIARRVEFLTSYQNAGYADQYRQFVERVRASEAALGKTALTEAVVRNLFKLMAYKDEYEVARLHSDPAFHARLASQFEGDFTLKVHLAPPLIARKNERGELVKQPFGPYMFKVFKLLARFKGLRGTPLDIFGRTEERRTERALIGQYRADVEALLAGLSATNHGLALEIARLPEQIKGFGHVKERHLAAARSRREALLQQWRQPEAAAHLARAA